MSIEKIDAVTYNVKSESDPNKEYMVWNSWRIGWTCTCMWFTIHERLHPPHPMCKHIKAVLETHIKHKR